jgi:integrase
MPRKKSPPRLYLDRTREQWVIRDGGNFVRTGCGEQHRGDAEKALAKYIGRKHRPQASATPLVDDVLTVYGTEHGPHTARPGNVAHTIGNLLKWWSGKRVSEIAGPTCRAYALDRPASAARRDLETLRAAVRYWHAHKHPLPVVPTVVLPDKVEGRERWLTRSEAAQLLRTARRAPHLARFILLGLYTGSRSGVLLGLEWSWVDLNSGTMRRRAPGKAESKTKRTPRVRLGSRILAHLRRWRRLDDAKVKRVVHYDGRPVTKLRRSWVTARDRAGLDDAVTPHTLRHTRATWMMHDRVDLWQAAGALGMSVRMLERTYGHHHPDWQKEAAEV